MAAAAVSADEWPVDPAAYKKIKPIGQGAFAKVWKGRCIPKGKDVAIKVMDLELVTSNLDHIRQEVATMKLCQHPNVLSCLACFMVDKELWLIMPFMDKGSCLEAMKQLKRKAGAKFDGFSEEVIAFVLREVLKGMMYLHESGWIHRDIKAGNILMDSNGSVKLADFGVAGILIDPDPLSRKANRNTFVGTPCWMAPEVMRKSDGYTEKADMWSFGITALELAKTYAPYAKERTMKVLLRTLEEPPPSLKTYEQYGDKGRKSGEFSRGFKTMIGTCLQKEPGRRPTAKKLLTTRFLKRAGDKSVPAALKKDVLTQFPSIDAVVLGQQSSRDPGTRPVVLPNQTDAKELASLEDDDVCMFVDPDKEAGATFLTLDTEQMKAVIKAATGKDVGAHEARPPPAPSAEGGGDDLFAAAVTFGEGGGF